MVKVIAEATKPGKGNNIVVSAVLKPTITT